MSPASVVAPSKCHRCKRYTAHAALKRNGGGVGRGKKEKKKKNLPWIYWTSAGEFTASKLPLSFTGIILRNSWRGFTAADAMRRKKVTRKVEKPGEKKKKSHPPPWSWCLFGCSDQPPPPPHLQILTRLQVAGWRCAFMAALHGASRKPCDG